MLRKRLATTPFVLLAFALATGDLSAPTGAESARKAAPKLDVSYEPTPQPVVNAMLDMAGVRAGDVVLDLGCGDGRIPITAATAYGAKGVGVDLDPQRIKEARANADRNGVVDKVSFSEGDLFKTDLGQATVITLFLWPDINIKLRPRLLDLSPGTRVVSHAHDMGDWRPDKKRVLGDSDVFLWTVPARINGQWQMEVGGRTMEVAIRQKYQRFAGSAVVDGRPRPIRNGRIDGAQVRFDLAVSGRKPQRFEGRLTPAGDIAGEGWQAKRKP
jgi:SAM-dependent methyltransferase